MPWQKYESNALMHYVLGNLDTTSASSRRDKQVSFNYEEICFMNSASSQVQYLN